MNRLDPSKLRQCWWVAFVLGCLMINYPFLHICNRAATWFGLPLFFVYLFLGWAASIGVIAFYAWLLHRIPFDEEG